MSALNCEASDNAPSACLFAENPNRLIGYTGKSLRLAFPRHLAARDRLVLVLDGYFDESGTHAGSDAVAVAGYLSTSEQWELFEREWQTALHEWGVECFHMTDFSNRAKVYRSWTDQECRFRFARLVSIINRHTLASIAIIIPVKSYNHIFSKQGKRFVGGPYGLAASACFMDAAKVMDADYPSARIAYVFEAGAPGGGEVLKVFQWNYSDIENRTRFKLLSLKFEGKEFVPLQAADILAYEMHKHLPRQIGIDQRKPRYEHMQLLEECKLRSWGYLEDEQLADHAKVIDLAAAVHGFGNKPFRGPRGCRIKR